MKHTPRIIEIVLIMGLAAGLTSSNAHAGAGYAVLDLGAIGVEAEAHGLNASGVTVGLSYDTIASHLAVRFDETGPVPLLGPGPSEQRQAVGINDAGLIAALSFFLHTLGAHAYLTDGTMPPIDIGEFIPRAIDAQGRMVGARPNLNTDLIYSERAAWWDGATLVDLPAYMGSTWSIAHDINGAGRIVGSALAAGARRPAAVLWEGGAAIDLGTLGGSSAQALAINDAGDVVGIADTALGMPHAFLFHLENGIVTERIDLGFLGNDASAAHDVNASRQAVGASQGHAFLWEEGVMHDLNDLVADLDGWELQSAQAINDSGIIVGHGLHAPHGRRAFMLVPQTECPADLAAPFGVLDLADLSAFTTAFLGGEPLADFDDNGIYDLADIGIFVMQFVAGCL